VKYGLATLNHIIDIYGNNQMVSYDIACLYTSTVAASSISSKARIHKLKLAVNAFHGHAHNLLCRLCIHPLYTPGIDLEDLETCKHVFPASNVVAHVIRYSSYFH
jgi:hypothetical protein